jgi:hypothetical protein
MSHGDDATDRTGLLSTVRRFDARLSKWGYGISGWAGVLIGVFSLVVAEELVAALPVSRLPIPEAVVEPLVVLVLVYASLGVAYHYRQRFGGPSCNV